MNIQTKEYDTFKDFYSDISLYGLLHAELKNFIFRGESTGTYELLPSALREDNIDKLFRASKLPENQWNWEYCQQTAEHKLLRNFFMISNNNGLKVPDVKVLFNDYYDFFPAKFFNEYREWLPTELSELAALAQHYGVLTRLLDWSFDINAAIYFASLGACKRKKNNNEKENDVMVIWALNFRQIELLRTTTKNIPIRFVVPTYKDNPNLNAQKGILSYIRKKK